MKVVDAVPNRTYLRIPIARGSIPRHAEKLFPYLHSSQSPALDPTFFIP